MVQTKLNVAAIQIVSARSWQTNLSLVTQMIAEAAMNGAELVVLPEFFIQIVDATDDNRFRIAEKLGDGPIQKQLSGLAAEYKIYLIAGTILIKSDNYGKYYNTSIVYDPSGEMISSYNKIHLFKFNDGTNSYDETETFLPGRDIVVCDIKGFRVGLSVCYDLRFPELYRQMGAIDACVLPSAFTYITGIAHWETLIKARAIENQCYFIAVNQGGIHETGRRTYGHSMVIDPWGNTLTACTEGNTVIYSTLSKQIIQDIRNSLPVLEHRKIS